MRRGRPPLGERSTNARAGPASVPSQGLRGSAAPEWRGSAYLRTIAFVFLSVGAQTSASATIRSPGLTPIDVRADDRIRPIGGVRSGRSTCSLHNERMSVVVSAAAQAQRD